jgi:hypothetical protein
LKCDEARSCDGERQNTMKKISVFSAQGSRPNALAPNALIRQGHEMLISD